jgi:HNH endonuclease
MSDCIEWQGLRNPQGYGRIGAAGVQWLAHRLVYTRAHGPIPQDMVVMHECDNPPCVNLEHLRLGTPFDNMRDRNQKGRQARLRGESNGKAKITLDQARKIASDLRVYTQIGQDYGISVSNVSDIKKGRIWPEVESHLRVIPRPKPRRKAA